VAATDGGAEDPATAAAAAVAVDKDLVKKALREDKESFIDNENARVGTAIIRTATMQPMETNTRIILSHNFSTVSQVNPALLNLDFRRCEEGNTPYKPGGADLILTRISLMTSFSFFWPAPHASR
jgi:hypothetical protein